MADRMNIESAPYALPIGYAGQAVTKPPNWHAYVVLDTLLNNLSTGLFLVAGTSELVRPESFAGLTRWAYPIALVLLILDLVCLVLDLGDPLRFHHMLRVWKPRSPMSLGTWCLTAFGPLLTANALLSLWPDSAGRLQWLRSLIFILGAVPAVGVTVYKGVLFSTTAQPGWKDARWLGGYFSCSALGAGTGELLLLATVLNRPEAMAPLRLPVPADGPESDRADPALVRNLGIPGPSSPRRFPNGHHCSDDTRGRAPATGAAGLWGPAGARRCGALLYSGGGGSAVRVCAAAAFVGEGERPPVPIWELGSVA
jgi:hypothetical protein